MHKTERHTLSRYIDTVAPFRGVAYASHQLCIQGGLASLATHSKPKNLKASQFIFGCPILKLNTHGILCVGLSIVRHLRLRCRHVTCHSFSESMSIPSVVNAWHPHLTLVDRLEGECTLLCFNSRVVDLGGF